MFIFILDYFLISECSLILMIDEMVKFCYESKFMVYKRDDD